MGEGPIAGRSWKGTESSAFEEVTQAVQAFTSAKQTKKKRMGHGRVRRCPCIGARKLVVRGHLFGQMMHFLRRIRRFIATKLVRPPKRIHQDSPPNNPRKKKLVPGPSQGKQIAALLTRRSRPREDQNGVQPGAAVPHDLRQLPPPDAQGQPQAKNYCIDSGPRGCDVGRTSTHTVAPCLRRQTQLSRPSTAGRAAARPDGKGDIAELGNFSLI